MLSGVSHSVYRNGWNDNDNDDGNGGVDFVFNALALRSWPTCTWLRLGVCMFYTLFGYSLGEQRLRTFSCCFL